MHIGTKYDAARDVVDVAKAFRADVAAAKRLPEGHALALPAGLKLSVRTRRFAGGRSIDVAVTAYPAGGLCNRAHYLTAKLLPHELVPWSRYTREAARVLAVLSLLLNEYNRKDVDSQTDYCNVAFFDSVDIDSRCERAHAASLPVDAELAADVAVTIASGRKAQALAQLATLNDGHNGHSDERHALSALLRGQRLAMPTAEVSP